jgi:hypothetical protein
MKKISPAGEHAGVVIRRIAQPKVALGLALFVAGCSSGRAFDPAASASIEAVFARAYWSEASGAEGDALRDYDTLAARYPESPLAAVARERAQSLSGKRHAVAPDDFTEGDVACTAPELYPNRARWCGVVRRTHGPYYLVEVTQLEFGTIWTFGFSRSVCTGNQFLSWFAYGDQIWVPRDCLGNPVTV